MGSRRERNSLPNVVPLTSQAPTTPIQKSMTLTSVEVTHMYKCAKFCRYLTPRVLCYASVGKEYSTNGLYQAMGTRQKLYQRFCLLRHSRSVNTVPMSFSGAS